MEYKKIIKISKNEKDKKILEEIPKERYMSSQKRQKIIYNLRSIIILW